MVLTLSVDKFSIFNFEDYRKYLVNLFSDPTKSKRGTKLELSRRLKIHTSYLSLVLRGDKNFTLEQALGVAQYFYLNHDEEEYFLKMLLLERAGTKELKQKFLRDLETLRSAQKEVGSKLQKNTQLKAVDQAIFYSSFEYSALRLSLGLKKSESLEDLAAKWNMSPRHLTEVLKFLVKNKLLHENGNGGYKLGKQTTYVSRDSPFVKMHHKNWRSIGLSKVAGLPQDELMFSAPVSLSVQDFDKVKILLLDCISNCSKVVAASPEEQTACLMIDWFKF